MQFQYRFRRKGLRSVASTVLCLIALVVVYCDAFVIVADNHHNNRHSTTGSSPFVYSTATVAATKRIPITTTTKTTLTRTTTLFCQLLGMNCAKPTDFGWSWPDFCERGGKTDVHADGWGLAYYQGRSGLRQFHDVEAASTSPLAAFLNQQPIRTANMLAHIRYATSGEVDLSNVHPFARE